MSGEAALDGQRSLFILSPADRDGLSLVARQADWRVLAVRRATDAAQRFLRSDARVALVDMRGVPDGDTRLIDTIVPAVNAGGGALVVLVDQDEIAAVPALLDAGATHFLAAPFSPEALHATLISAQRLVDRLGGGVTPSQRAQRIRRGDALFWDMDRANGAIRLSDSF
ncbi:MAG TPA: diguanylate cyclase, partial [Sphingobium sp.]